jgi:acyl-[acyl-carrier-protein]-phospholipid O-acyltransferase/long-chain-fatty-acid--[acyl-carrier-protein] ligase
MSSVTAHSTKSLRSAEPEPTIGEALRHESLPTLSRDASFWSMAVTQFLGAFNDNVFKQLILLLATPTVAQVAAGTAEDLQSQAQLVFAASFLIFSGFAGYLSDRFSKRPIVILSKAAEIVCMLLGMVGFFFYDLIGFPGMLCVLFLMGTQSAFFGPSKYGILPEMLRPADLPRANGIFLMLTFLAIIFGMAAAGELKELLGNRLWIASLVCVGIAVLGTITSLWVRRVPPAQPDLEYRASCWVISNDMLALLRKDRELLWAIVSWRCSGWSAAWCCKRSTRLESRRSASMNETRACSPHRSA